MTVLCNLYLFTDYLLIHSYHLVYTFRYKVHKKRIMYSYNIILSNCRIDLMLLFTFSNSLSTFVDTSPSILRISLILYGEGGGEGEGIGAAAAEAADVGVRTGACCAAGMYWGRACNRETILLLHLFIFILYYIFFMFYFLD